MHGRLLGHGLQDFLLCCDAAAAARKCSCSATATYMSTDTMSAYSLRFADCRLWFYPFPSSFSIWAQCLLAMLSARSVPCQCCFIGTPSGLAVRSVIVIMMYMLPIKP